MALKIWKKVLESDLLNLLSELRENVQSPAVLFLEGDLGAGKTTFIKYFFIDHEHLGSASANASMANDILSKKEHQNLSDKKNFLEVSSPSYSLINEYGDVLHGDLYRIEKKEELVHLELPMYLEDKQFVLLEWGLRYKWQIQNIVGDEFKYYQISIEFVQGQPLYRNITLDKVD